MRELFYLSDFGGSWTADLSDWGTSKVTDMSYMFAGCSNLTKVELPHTERVTEMWDMFYNCENLEQDFSDWNVENTIHKFMFSGCTRMEESKLYPTGYKE